MGYGNLQNAGLSIFDYLYDEIIAFGKSWVD